ncbi:hypothetical protein PsorP6_017738 [Peronosclerospora sorghi]|uniref:Uncharacterized protein n=1 Tax=Peronosclerospora sorghi TaxID=230839 RepID=A0ACC0WKN9_9STRA|nr:hypothetical protein PsorP6_017738 [Peronosclerospora sorghi]
MCLYNTIEKTCKKLLHIVLLITPPCVIDSVRHNDLSNASAAKYAKLGVELAAAKNVHVLDLHTYFNKTYPDETVRKIYFIDGLHFSKKRQQGDFMLLGIVIDHMFDKYVLNKFSRWQLTDWHGLFPYHAKRSGHTDKFELESELNLSSSAAHRRLQQSHV